jgi:dUTPase
MTIKVMIDIPMESYLLCMTRCGLKSPEYLMLKNGVIVRDSEGTEVVQILCNRERAKMILEAIAALCPESLSRVEQRPFAPSME